MDELRRRAAQQADAPHAFDTIALSPPDEVRRFPLFTQAQLMLLLVGLGLLLIGLVIAYLLWSRDRTDAGLTLSAPPAAGLPGTLPSFLPETSPTFDPNATPTPALSNDDQALLEEAKKVLAAYNPTGVANYKLAIKDGVVTLNGSAEHAPEKEGATNVLRLVAGIKQVVNNLNVKADSPLPTASLTPTPVVAGVNPPATAPTATPAEANPPANNAAAEAEAERLRRELEASRQREAELQRQRDAAEQQRQRDAEAQRQRDADEAARRQQQQEENRRQEAERAPTRPRRAETDPLRSGTVAWSGVVDGVDEIVIGGSSAAVRHVSGDAVRDARASFSAAVPRAPVGVKLLSTSGRGTIQIVQEPSAANGYTTIVRIDDSPQHGGQTHQFTLRWSQQ